MTGHTCTNPPALTIFCHVFSYMVQIYIHGVLDEFFVCLIKTYSPNDLLRFSPAYSPAYQSQTAENKPVTSNSARGCFIYTQHATNIKKKNVKRVSYHNNSRNQFSSDAT